jgi:hypothetical protein
MSENTPFIEIVPFSTSPRGCDAPGTRRKIEILGHEYPAATNFEPANIFSGRTTKRDQIEIFTGTSTFRMATESRTQSLHILFIAGGLKDFVDNLQRLEPSVLLILRVGARRGSQRTEWFAMRFMGAENTAD